MVDGYIQDDAIDRIRNSTDIVEVLSDYVPLKKTGQNYKGLCPFHSEKTPSFIVSPSKQLYHCFGCGAGGDIFNFLVRYENLTFPEAVKLLAKRAGINIETRVKDLKTKSEKETLLKVNREAVGYFHDLLMGPSGKDGREYLQKRGIKDGSIKDFKLGFSLQSWDGLLTALHKKGYSAEVLVKAGLVIPRESGKGHYDRFRGRLIFPIYNIGGDVVGFGGRILDDSLPKYINSPETPVYSKSENLYALDKAKAHIRKEGFLILVEGYMDALALHQSGIGNTAATLGTALTKGHIRAIKRFTNKAVVVFDADPAGKKAASMGLDIFIEEGMTVRVSSLPQGDDPDSFIIREGRDKFIDILNEAENLIDFSLKQILTFEAGPKTRGSTEMFRKFDEALTVVSKIPNSIERGYYIKRLSEKAGIDEAFFMEELRKIKGPKKIRSSQFAVHSSPLRPKAEEILIHLMLKDKSHARTILGKLNPEDFTYGPFGTIAEAVKRSIEKFKKIMPERFIDQKDAPEAFALLTELSLKDMEYDDIEKVIHDCLLHMSRSERGKKLSDLLQKIKEAEIGGREEEVLSLLSEKQKLARSGLMDHHELKTEG